MYLAYAELPLPLTRLLCSALLPCKEVGGGKKGEMGFVSPLLGFLLSVMRT